MNREYIKQIFKIVCVVENLDEVICNWKRMVVFDQSSIKTYVTGKDVEHIYKGKEIFFAYKYVDFDMGGIEMRLIEPLDKTGGDPYSDALIEKGPGFHHLGVYTDDINAMTEKYNKVGIKPVYTENMGSSGYSIYDFEQTTGLCIAPFDEMTGPCAR